MIVDCALPDGMLTADEYDLEVDGDAKEWMWIVIGIGGASLCGFCASIMLCCYCYRKRVDGQNKESLSSKDQMNEPEKAVELGMATVTVPTSGRMSLD